MTCAIATGTVRNTVVVDTHIRETASFGMATDKWDPHRQYERDLPTEGAAYSSRARLTPI
jgi:hypothetical protein